MIAMKAQVFDRITRDLGAMATRRSVFRLLGSAVALGAVAVVGLEVDAKGKTKHGKGNHQADAKGKHTATLAAKRKKHKKPHHPTPGGPPPPGAPPPPSGCTPRCAPDQV